MLTAILQPGFFPWLGYFEQVLRVDVFVHFDDTYYTKRSWRARNRIKTLDGIKYISVPVQTPSNEEAVQNPFLINEIKVDNEQNWQKKILGQLKHNYCRAKHFEEIFPVIEVILAKEWEYLVDLNYAVIDQMLHWFEIDTKIERSSALNLGDSRKTQRLLDICKALGAKRLYEGAAGKDYMDESLLNQNEVELVYQNYQHPVYPQLQGDFVSHLSAIDCFMNCGIQKTRDLLKTSSNGSPNL